MNSPDPAQVLQVLPAHWPSSKPLIVFGLLLAFGVLGGALSARVRWLPSITAYMALGVIIGPSGLGLLSKDALHNSRVLIDIALGLILFRLGGTLHPHRALANRSLVLTSLVESVGTALAVGVLMLAIGASVLVSLLAAAIAVSSSPAVLIHVAEELGAHGVVVSDAKWLVAANNLLSFLLFSLLLPIGLIGSQINWVSAIAWPSYQALGGALLAVVVALGMAGIARISGPHEPRLRFALVIGAVALTLGTADALQVSSLFAGLCLGMACRVFQGHHRLTRVELGGGGDVFFVVLFVFAGAKVNLGQLWEVLPLALALAFVLTRLSIKVMATYLCARRFGVAPRPALGTGLLLVPMAGLAIGLVQTSSPLMPELAGPLSAIVLASVALFEAIGPPVASFALRFVGAARS